MKTFIVIYFALILLGLNNRLFAHCDTKDGPVILAAQKALTTGNVNLVLIWVQQKDERAIKDAFQKTLELRKLSSAVQKMVDNYFFETLVRIHRAGEGAPYTGLKDSTEVEIPIAATDKAIESGSANEVIKLLNEMLQKEVNEKFKNAFSKKNYDPNNVAAGREYVESYVTFMHYVEGIYNAINAGEAGHNLHGGENISNEYSTSLPTEISRLKPPVNETNECTTHLLIIGCTLLIIVVQILLHNRKKHSKN